MEPLSLAAATIAKLIFSKVLEKNGKEIGDQLAEAASNKVSQLLNFVREKFQKEGVEGKLTKAQEEPSEVKIKKFETELVDQMSEDEEFAKKMQAFIAELKSDEQLTQIFFKDVEVAGDAEIGGSAKRRLAGGMLSRKRSRTLRLAAV